ncbi:3'-5' exonuclease [uncultured Duncaniella sp.]|uniref:3'-5' exonuclease n=2 Tax=uncultured Duncaniella sp. TaxID=2768039 RepID=UPI0025FAE9FD|nr:3'-5' exonuclease [uncultured Duncaniella sp.]
MDINQYSISISKEQLSGLPTVEFPGAITVLENIPDAQEALRYLRTCQAVGFDTETKPNFRKGQTNTVSLIQISTLDHSFLFRLNKLGFFDELREFMECEDVVKVGLSLRDDFHVLHRLAPFEPANFVDLQNVVKTFHIADSSLQKIYGIIFNGRISKSQRLSNWEAAQLSPGQLIYASIDAWACLRIYKHLMDGCFDPAESEYIKEEEESC